MNPNPHVGRALPPAAVLTIALLASGSVHVPVYVGLGLLKDLFELPELPATPIELELWPTDRADDESPEGEPDDAREDAPVPRERARSSPGEDARAVPERARAERVSEMVLAPSARSRPPPPQSERLTSVEHRSRNPDVEPPPDAQHLASENSRVEEEMQARVRNPLTNDDTTELATPSDADDETEGDAEEAEQAHLRDADGNDERDPTMPEAQIRVREREASRSPDPAVARAARGDRRLGASDEPGAAREAAGGGTRTQGGGETFPTREIMVADGTGTFAIRVPSRPEGSGEGIEGGEAVAGVGLGHRGAGRAAGRAGHGRRVARGGSAPGRGAPDLRLSWTDFASIYGADELQRERELAIAQRRSRTRGANRAERWRRFRAAIENYDVRVRPGNQTALNTRADPFASYIAAMHRRIHPRFALGFLHRVPSTVDDTFRGNRNMHTNLELAIDAEGRVDHVSVVSTSGDILFDLGAFEAVMGAQPFPAPPPNIRSPDGLAYLHWGFFRNQRQCGTFNARPFILASAPRRRREPRDTLTEPGPAMRPSEE